MTIEHDYYHSMVPVDWTGKPNKACYIIHPITHQLITDSQWVTLPNTASPCLESVVKFTRIHFEKAR